MSPLLDRLQLVALRVGLSMDDLIVWLQTGVIDAEIHGKLCAHLGLDPAAENASDQALDVLNAWQLLEYAGHRKLMDELEALPTGEDLQLLEQAGLIERTATNGGLVEYRIVSNLLNPYPQEPAVSTVQWLKGIHRARKQESKTCKTSIAGRFKSE